jgi:hypothetical protein
MRDSAFRAERRVTVQISESYRDYRPPRWVRPTIERLLAGIPARYSSGVGTVVLTDAASIGPGKTRRVAGRKRKRNACAGFYYERYRGKPAYIEIVVDNALAGLPSGAAVLNLFRDMTLGHVLYHELGHHLDATIGAAAPTGEAAAEDWGRRLRRLYFRRRYWWLRPVGRPLARMLKRVARWLSSTDASLTLV